MAPAKNIKKKKNNVVAVMIIELNMLFIITTVTVSFYDESTHYLCNSRTFSLKPAILLRKNLNY